MARAVAPAGGEIGGIGRALVGGDSASKPARTGWPDVASIGSRQTAGGRRYDVRYRDPDGTQRMRTFRRKIDAEHFASTVEADKLRGTYIDHNAGKVTFEAYAVGWLAMQTFDEMTRYNVGLRLRKHVFPGIGHLQLRQLRPPSCSRGFVPWRAWP